MCGCCFARYASRGPQSGKFVSSPWLVLPCGSRDSRSPVSRPEPNGIQVAGVVAAKNRLKQGEGSSSRGLEGKRKRALAEAALATVVGDGARGHPPPIMSHPVTHHASNVGSIDCMHVAACDPALYRPEVESRTKFSAPPRQLRPLLP